MELKLKGHTEAASGHFKGFKPLSDYEGQRPCLYSLLET